MSTELRTSADPPAGLRITFWGTQGSGSVFPSAAERLPLWEQGKHDLLAAVFRDLKSRSDEDGRIGLTIEQILGPGGATRDNLLAYVRRLAVPEPRVYDGLTTCVGIETADGYDVAFDCGSGFRNYARDLQERWGGRPEREVHVFGSHSHLDHTEGFDQAAICFDPRNRVKVYGNRQFLHALDANLGVFSHQVAADRIGVQTPIFFGLMPARFEACEIRQTGGDPAAVPDALAGSVHDQAAPVRLGRTIIHPFHLYHPAPCLGYRVEHCGKVFVFCTDHEFRRGPEGVDDPRQQASAAAERRLLAMSRSADLLYRDGQYLQSEYRGEKGIGKSGPAVRVDWGHSSVEDVVAMSRQAGVKRCLIGHHDPNRDWADRRRLDDKLAAESIGTETEIELAFAGLTVDL